MRRVSIPSFILAFLYFITIELKLACYGYTHISSYIKSEQEALIDFKSGIKDPNNRLSSWRDANYCYWLGIACENDTGYVISIDLHNPYPRKNIFIYENWNSMNLSGEIRPSLEKLKHLKYLDLSFNSFRDMAIPQFFGSLQNLLYLNLSSAGFSGKIPSNLGNLSNLQCLDLSSSSIGMGYPNNLYASPTSFGFFGYSNNLYVENFEWLTNLVSLKYLGLDYVGLASIGSQWAKVINKLQNLTELHLFRCDLDGLVPPSLGELPNLKHLDLSENYYLDGDISQLLNKSWRNIEILKLGGNGFHGSIPSSMGKFCNLSYLDLSHNEINGSLPKSVTGHETCRNPLSNLTVLKLGFNELLGKLPDLLGEFRNLKVLDLSYNHLEGLIPDSLWRLHHLEYLDLAMNEQINGSLPCSIGQLSQLQHMDMSSNLLSGSLPYDIGQLPRLQYLDVSKNRLSGSLPNGIEQLSQLQFLDISVNNLNGSLPDSIGQLSQLQRLHLSSNNLSGSLPDSIGQISHQLQILDVSHNHLSGNLPDSIGQLSQLQLLDVSYNHLSGNISEQHFWNLSKLETLSMGSNSFHLDVSSEWTPPFQVSYLDMHSCHLGPPFPTWLQSQINLFHTLDFSNASISSPIPNWFWNISFNLEVLDLSQNMLHGQLPTSLNFSRANASIDFSSNLLEEPIPFSIDIAGYLDLSHNKFSGPLPSIMAEKLYYLSIAGNGITGTIPESIGLVNFLILLDFSSNNLTGTIPSSLGNCFGLSVLDLGNNSLSGEIPKSLGQLSWLQSLHLNHNNLSGGLPSSFQNLTRLEVLDVSYNKLSSEVPSWIGAAFPNLVILSLRSNILCGRIPSHISNLSSLHVLDLAHNNLMGEIPVTLGELKSMANTSITIYSLHRQSILYEERLVVISKGQSLEYTRTLSLVVAIDLSNNNLRGGFPKGITKLSGLMVLNLSKNHIIGQIPESISMLGYLSSLDLSSNELSGSIPTSMVALTFLEYLNLSHNKFFGKIPFTGQLTTFDKSSFEGNHDLCGPPLSIKCQDEDEDSNRREPNVDNKDYNDYVDKWFYLSIGLGFATGLLVPYFVLVIRKSWCETYFGLVDGILKWLLRRRTTYTKYHHRRRG